MIVFPAIDIRGGKCVRLTEGRFDAETVFADDPAAVARRWAAEGAEYLHVVDLDGARAGRPINLAIVSAIVAAAAVPVQLGGGIRTLADIEAALAAGVTRVILGSAAVRRPALVKEACAAYGGRIVVGIDARDGVVAVEGWGVSGGIQAEDLAVRMAAAGVARIIHTDIVRDGTLAGVNVASARALARAAGVPVIASGGVASLADIAAVRTAAGDGVEGVIIGKALYTGAVGLPAALKAARGEETSCTPNG